MIKKGKFAINYECKSGRKMIEGYSNESRKNVEEEESLNLPLGFSFTLANNTVAMERFANMSRIQQEAIVEESRQVSSKQEMAQLVNRLAESNKTF